MPNMSYCRFENTYNDLRDCMSALLDEGLDAPSSPRELDYAAAMATLATRYLEVYKRAEILRDEAHLGIEPDE